MNLGTLKQESRLSIGNVFCLFAALVLALCVAVMTTSCGGNGAKKVDGLRAGGLDAGAVNGAKFGIRRGKFMELGFISLTNNGKSPAVIESAIPIPNSVQVEVTQARVWVFPPKTKNLLPYADTGWPPEDAPLIRKLPSENVAIPSGKKAQLVFGVRSLAPVGKTVRITRLRVLFKQGGQRYDWTFPLPVEMLTVKPVPVGN
jgi:hypothetical protein